MAVAFTVNGKAASVDVDANTPLLWVVREHLKLTGTKFGCGAGLCGACTVHLDGKAVRSCQTAISEVAGKTVTTIEQQSPGAAARLLSGLDSRHVVLSLPRKSLSGRRDYSDDASAIVARAVADGPYRLTGEAAFGTESLYHLESSPR